MMLRIFALLSLSLLTTEAAFEEWVDILLNDTEPLPLCSVAGVQDVAQCVEICAAIGDEYKTYLDVNDKMKCFCKERDACSDDPLCAQLKIFPGMAEASCRSHCGNDALLSFKDEIQLAGGIENANKNQTHNIVQCMCDGVVKCDDFVLFSDLSFLKACKELQIESQEACQTHCDTGAFATAEYTKNGAEGTCTCKVPEGNITSCQDTQTAPSETPDPGESRASGRTMALWLTASVMSMVALL